MGLLQCLTRAGERVALIVDQILDLQNKLNIFAAIEALSGAAFFRVELGKLCLPKAQDIGFDTADTRHIANLEVKAVGDQGRNWCAILRKLHGHSEDEQSW